MFNLKIERTSEELIVRIPLVDADPPRRSKTGKTLVIASTEGNQKVSGKAGEQEVIVGVNAYVYPERERVL
tara:strand:- start:138 stop:350 length:213 start_codon:yes stop_codon:yes gene_type:complete